ncbi:MAG TPA: bifunctional phosphoribosylaminoimidazolecarboxamide formyltransferase/IMP cyclohydrolase [Chitinophagaceae bacterium]|nr:bifunctional phosphoribosylaminoimidazolecarboxamide formyltransferase/IMP cyclohydrolase [Chitinophagaceae bacterium]
MTKKIQSALISVFYKEGLEPVVKQLHSLGVKIFSTGGTQKFIEELKIPVTPVETLTNYPSILGGRVKTLHPSIFGGVLGRREVETDLKEMKDYNIPEIDLVIVDLYPFEETLASTNDEKAIIEKIDIGGPSMIRAAAKNFKHVMVVAAKDDYSSLVSILKTQNGETSVEQRKSFAAKAFEVVKRYDIAISDYFNTEADPLVILRYGENPHQHASYKGDLSKVFTQLHGKELSYNNLVDIEAAIQLIKEFDQSAVIFAIIKHTNVCGIAARSELIDSWKSALAGDPESAFGGVLICNNTIDEQTAESIDSIFFEVLIAYDYDPQALKILQSKKNRILLQLSRENLLPGVMYKSILDGILQQDVDKGNFLEWKEVGGRESSEKEKEDLKFANIVCKHLKSNAIALVHNKQLIGKGCGQTSRIDALRQALEKARQFDFDLQNAVMASDAFFPFNDCVKMGHAAGINTFIQPGGSIRDKESIDYCIQHDLAMVLTGLRHFRH